MKKWLNLLFFLGGAVLSQGATVSPCIKVGIMGEFETASGRTSSPFGVDIRNGVSLAIQRLKEKGSHTCFDPIEVDIDNSISNIPDVIRKKVNQDGIKFFLGLGTSDQAQMAITPLRELNGLLFTPTASSEDLVGPDSREILLFPRNSLIAYSLAKRAIGLGYRKAAMIYSSNNKYSSNMAKMFRQSFKDLGGQIVREISARNADVTSEMLVSVPEFGAELIFLPVFELDASRILNILQGLRLQLPVFGADSWGTTSQVIRATSKGVDINAILPLIYRADFSYDQNKQLSRLAQAKGISRINDLLAFSYEGLILLANMIEKCGGQTLVLKSPGRCLDKILPIDSLTGKITSRKYLSLNRNVAIRRLKAK